MRQLKVNMAHHSAHSWYLLLFNTRFNQLAILKSNSHIFQLSKDTALVLLNDGYEGEVSNFQDDRKATMRSFGSYFASLTKDRIKRMYFRNPYKNLSCYYNRTPRLRLRQLGMTRIEVCRPGLISSKIGRAVV